MSQPKTSQQPQSHSNNDLGCLSARVPEASGSHDLPASSLRSKISTGKSRTIESWLLQWPTAATAVRQNPQLPAERLLSLVEPVEQLLTQWNVEAIATVGEEMPYDPQYHQLMKGIAQPGRNSKGALCGL